MAITQAVEITKDCTIDGKDYEKGKTAKLTPFQARCAVEAGAAKEPKPVPVSTTTIRPTRKSAKRK